ncbi:unnamed protein product [Symbiodinium necroappetens]|uniref:Uncharacterized protein n=1 Tax=Symbiodinium necroappetens TaxID=1628268 RepID=A0A812YP30_9DINO|nr:unnamed protein product [Symbiodinium necroappetens]
MHAALAELKCKDSLPEDKAVSPTMPPSKKAIPAKKDIDAPGLGDLPPSSFDPNIEHFKMIEASINEIKAHPLFGPHIDQMDPLPLVPADKDDLAGFLAPLDREQMKLSRESGSEYFCGVNLLWGNPLESITPGVPIMAKAVADLVQRLLKRGPKILEDRLEFVFPGPADMRWRRCSPEEQQHAVIMAVHEAILTGAPDSQLLEWKRVLLSCPANFVHLATEQEVYFYTTNKRFKAEADHRAITHKTTQMIFDVWNFKVRKEVYTGALSADDVATLYGKNLIQVNRRSGGGNSQDDKDRTKPGTIKACIHVYEKMLTHEALRQIVLAAEQDFLDSSPFAGVYKLQEMCRLCKDNVSKLEWLLGAAYHRFRAGTLHDFSLRNLATAGTKQHALVLLKQREMKIWLLGPFLDARNILSECKSKLREVFASRDSFMKLLRPVEEEEQENIDVSWQATWPKSALLTLELLEISSFSVDTNEESTVRLGIKHGKSGQELLEEYSPFKEKIQEIDACLKEELKAINDASKSQGGDSEPDQPPNIPNPSGAGPSRTSDMDEAMAEGMDLESKRLAHAKRIMSSYLVLESEEDKKTSGALASALKKHKLVQVDTASMSGNLIIALDVNAWGEAITAPHIRRPPIQQAILKKIFEAIGLARRGVSAWTTMAPGEIVICLNGGRTNNSFLSKLIGVGPGVGRSKSRGSNIMWREITATFTPESVQTRRVRTSRKALASLKCSQKMFWWFDAGTDIPVKAHKHCQGQAVH